MGLSFEIGDVGVDGISLLNEFYFTDELLLLSEYDFYLGLLLALLISVPFSTMEYPCGVCTSEMTDFI